MLQRLTLRTLTNDKQLRIAMRQHRHRIDEIAMSLPAAQRRADTDQRGRFWQTQPTARLLLIARREAQRVDASRYRGHARRIDADVADQRGAYRLAGSDHVRRGLGVKPAREAVARHGRRNVASAYQRWRRLQRTAGERDLPSVGRAVRVDRVDRVLRKKPSQRGNALRALATDGQRRDGDAEARRFGEDSGAVRACKGDLMTVTDHACGFGENADFLAAPAERGLSMKNAQRNYATAVANWIRCSFAYSPFRASSSAWVPCSTTRPASSTTMRSTRSIVDNRWAMTMVVRPFIN